MSWGRDPVLIFFTVVGGLILAGLVVFAPWPLWVPLGVVALIAVVIALMRSVRPRRPDPEPPPIMTPQPPPMEQRKYPVQNVPLPSREPDYDFLFSATVVWTPLRGAEDEMMANLAGLAVNAVLERARKVTEQWEPERASLVQHELGAALGTMRPDADGCVRAMAEDVEITLPDEDRDRLNTLAAVRKSKAIWEHERIYEQSRRAYLSEDVLKDIGSAVAWWLAKNDERVEKVVNDIPLLVTLSSAINGKEPTMAFATNGDGTFPPRDPFPSPSGNGFPSGNGSPSGNSAETVADRFAVLLSTLDFPQPQVNPLFATLMARAIGKYGRPDAAEEIARRFGTPPPPTAPTEEPPNDETADSPETSPRGADGGD